MRHNPPSGPDRVTKAHTAERVAFALQAWGREKSSPIKRIQKIADVDRKTAEAWWHGRNPPASDLLITLARQIPELKAEVRRLIELDADHDAGFQRELSELLRRYRR